MILFRNAVVIPSAVVLIVLGSTGFASSQQAAVRYKNAYNLSGFLLRSAIVCSNRKKLRVERALGLIATPELKALSAAFPQQTRAWAIEGAQTFNAGVMQKGIARMCN